MSFGYTGKILKVDLASGIIEIDEPSDQFYRTYLGGSAMNMHYMLKEMDPTIDALSPDSILCLSVGLATGLAISGQSRMTATAKSPLTGGIGDAQSGGFWPAELKKAGFDGLVIKGKADHPVYLWIKDNQVEIRDASKLWGKLTADSERMIKEELDEPKLKTVQIGPGGEKMVRFAAIMSSNNRANGRTGLGAVMGSKNLKAVAVRGTKSPKPADKSVFKELSVWGAKNFSDSGVAFLERFGTSEVVGSQQQGGGLPTRNFTAGVFEGWEGISAKPLFDRYLKGAATGEQMTKGRDTCHGCMVRCKPVVEITEGKHKVDPIYGGPEYESLASLGSYCANGDMTSVCKANELCNAYGLDTISCGGTIAWVMDMFETGQLTSAETGGLDIKFGDSDMVVQLVRMIGDREGFGDLLAEGSARVARRLGKGEELLTTSKDQEAPAHMPQVKPGQGLTYSINSFGADHCSSEHDPGYETGYPVFEKYLTQVGLTKPQPTGSIAPEKVKFVTITQYMGSVTDSLCLCRFVWGSTWQLYGPDHMVRLINSVTGWDVDIDELIKVGKRRVYLMRAFNFLAGFGIDDDRLPEKFHTKGLKGGPTDGVTVDFEAWLAAKSEYYRQTGLDPATGAPTRTGLEELGLDWVADKMAV